MPLPSSSAPDLTFPLASGGSWSLADSEATAFTIVVFYRGTHCPICKNFLAEIEEQVEAWRNRFIFNYVNEFYSVARLMYNELDDRDYDFVERQVRVRIVLGTIVHHCSASRVMCPADWRTWDSGRCVRTCPGIDNPTGCVWQSRDVHRD